MYGTDDQDPCNARIYRDLSSQIPVWIVGEVSPLVLVPIKSEEIVVGFASSSSYHASPSKFWDLCGVD